MSWPLSHSQPQYQRLELNFCVILQSDALGKKNKKLKSFQHNYSGVTDKRQCCLLKKEDIWTRRLLLTFGSETELAKWVCTNGNENDCRWSETSDYKRKETVRRRGWWTGTIKMKPERRQRKTGERWREGWLEGGGVGGETKNKWGRWTHWNSGVKVPEIIPNQ